MVVTEPTAAPRIATGLRLRVRIRSPANTTASCCAALPVRTSSSRSSTPSSVQRPPDAVGRQAEHPVGLGVDQRDAVVQVEAEHALLDPGEHRLAVLDEPADLDRLQPEGLALDPPRDEQRPGDPDDPGQPEVGQQVRHRGEQALAEARVRLPDRGRARPPARSARRCRRRPGRAATTARPPVPSLSPTDERPRGRVGRGRRAARGRACSRRRRRRRPRSRRTTRPTGSARRPRSGTAWSTRAGRDGRGPAPAAAAVRAARLSAAESTRAPSVRRKSICAWASVTPPTPTSTTAMMPSCRARSWPATDHRLAIEEPPSCGSVTAATTTTPTTVTTVMAATVTWVATLPSHRRTRQATKG